MTLAMTNSVHFIRICLNIVMGDFVHEMFLGLGDGEKDTPMTEVIQDETERYTVSIDEYFSIGANVYLTFFCSHDVSNNC